MNINAPFTTSKENPVQLTASISDRNEQVL